jgi:hypothetical protein
MRPPPSVFPMNWAYTLRNSSFNKSCIRGKCNQSNENGEVAIEGTVLCFAGTSLVFSMVRVWQEFLHPLLLWSLCIESVPLSIKSGFGSEPCVQISEHVGKIGSILFARLLEIRFCGLLKLAVCSLISSYILDNCTKRCLGLNMTGRTD